MIMEDNNIKLVRSEDYNYNFNKQTGLFMRWGRTPKDDPIQAPMPEILDLEISQGKCMGKCPECYKCNGDVEETYNMSFDTFRKVFHLVADTHIVFDDKSLPIVSMLGNIKSTTKAGMLEELKLIGVRDIQNKGLLTQIAFGLCDIGTNPDFFHMMEYCREFGVIPNYTCHGLDMTDEYADKTAKLAGAVAVSVHRREQAYNTIKKLTDRGMTQVNIHAIVHDKSYNQIMSLIDDIKADERLAKLNALVLLRYKPKGNGVGKFEQLSLEQYRNIINYAKDKGVSIGFDSCSAPIYLAAIKGDKELEHTEVMVEPCESSLFSSYINCKGEFFACSFCEGEKHTVWETGINVLEYTDFRSVWNHEKTTRFRNTLLGNCRNCPMFRLERE